MDVEELFANPIFGEVIKDHFERLNEANLTHWKESMVQFEIALIEKAMEVCEGNKAAAARLLGINRTTLIEMFKKKGYKDREVARFAPTNSGERRKVRYMIDRMIITV